MRIAPTLACLALLTPATFAATALGQAAPPAPAPPTSAPAAPLPDAKMLVKQGLTPLGGEAMLARIASLAYTLSIEQPMAPAGEPMTATLATARPDRMHITMDSPMGPMEAGRQGSVFWGSDPQSGQYMMLPAMQQPQLMMMDTCGRLLALTDKDRVVETVATETFNGASCHKVRVGDPKAGPVWFAMFAADGGALTGFADMMGGMAVETHLSEPKPLPATASGTPSNGTLFSKASIAMGGQVMATLTVKVTGVNSVDAKTFEMPAEIKEQVEARKEAEKKASEAAPPAGAGGPVGDGG